MLRLENWHSRLATYLASIARTPWHPGSHDCVTFAADWRQAVTGVDLLGDFRGVYTTLEEGFDLLAAQGWTDHIAAATQGLTECPPLAATLGDLVAVQDGDRDLAMGGCGGPHLHVLTPRGLGTLPLTAAVRAWRL